MQKKNPMVAACQNYMFDEVKMKLFIYSSDLSYKNHKSGEVPVYKRESMQLYHNMVGCTCIYPQT